MHKGILEIALWWLKKLHLPNTWCRRNIVHEPYLSVTQELESFPFHSWGNRTSLKWQNKLREYHVNRVWTLCAVLHWQCQFSHKTMNEDVKPRYYEQTENDHVPPCRQELPLWNMNACLLTLCVCMHFQVAILVVNIVCDDISRKNKGCDK